MNSQKEAQPNKARRFAGLAIAAALVAPLGSVWAQVVEEELAWDFKRELFLPVEKWIEELKESENEEGIHNKRGTMSKSPQKLDDGTYRLGVHVNTAEEFRQVTERYAVTLKKEGGRWTIADKEVVDTYVGLYRENGTKCYPFDKFSFEREGLTLTASKGTMCESFLEGNVSSFGLSADTMSHSYTPPEHATQLATGRDYRELHQLMAKEHMKELFFGSAAYMFRCDLRTCEELISQSFQGLERIPPEERAAVRYDKDDESMPAWVRDLIRETVKDRREHPFSEFRVLDPPDHSYYSVFLARDLDLSNPSGYFLACDNWGGWEVQVGVVPKRFDIPNQLIGPVFGYYTKETLERDSLYEIESRPDAEARWFEVHSVKGKVDLAIDDPEMLEGDIEFGLTLRQDVEELPFRIISNRQTGALGGNRPAPLYVNSVQLEGQELTWIRTGSTSGRIVLPEPAKAGAKIKLRMDFTTRAIVKLNHSFSSVNRSGWMPFVRFGDMIDEIDLVVRSPSQYTILGPGHKIEDKVEGAVRVSHWKSDYPVNAATIIFGKYRTDAAKFNALKADGETVIPVHVSVDEASFSDWDIRESTLREIAEQAVNSINLFTFISGWEYPFGELNLLNDARGGLYGETYASTIYLGSAVFWGEARLAPDFRDASSISRFKRSVVAHEVGHLWWGASISHANQRNRWFRESLAEYFSALYLEAAFGYDDYLQQVAGWRRNLLESNLKANVQNAQTLFPGEWGGGEERSSRQAAVYDKGPYAFHMLREIFRDPTIAERGPEGADRRFFTFLRLFTQELAKKQEIVTLDIQRAAESGLGGVDQQGNRVNADLGWFFDQWIRGVGIPSYDFSYDVRRAEDGSYVVDGTVKQRVVIGTSKSAPQLEGQVYRGFVFVTAKAKGGPVKHRVIVNGPETPFQFKVPKKPFEVVLNEDGEMLALDVTTN